MTDDPTLAVAIDLRAIIDLAGDLRAQAVARAGGQLPGGDAMVCLAPVASPAEWERQVELIEAAWFDGDQTTPRPDVALDEDSTWEPPLQTLLFWTEIHRMEDA